MDNKFHIFVIFATIIAYVFINSQKTKNSQRTVNFNFVYVPLILYGFNYFYYQGLEIDKLNKNKILNYIPTDFEELLSEPFPASTSFSF